MIKKIKGPQYSSLLKPFQDFFSREASGGIVLIIFTIIALIWANSSFSQVYHSFWNTTFTIGTGTYHLSKPLLLWINDGLMALFFFLVGLEIKREISTGELSQPGKIVLPVSAAIGGMIFPALIYYFFNSGKTGLDGWAIPIATDIAFSLGILSLLGNRIPTNLKIFVTAFAIVDDIGAVLIIALFYTTDLSTVFLLVSGIIFLFMIFLNKKNVQKSIFYIIPGLLLWFMLLKSGIHATIAGILCAVTIPAINRTNRKEFTGGILKLTKRFDVISLTSKEITDEQRSILTQIRESTRSAESMLQRMEHALLPWVTFFIIPLFALANAGVTINLGLLNNFFNPVTMGIILGLFIGNQLGITTFTWLAVKTGMATLPTDMRFYHVYGASCLAGIGFTMSLFVTGLSFTDTLLIDQAKMGIIVGSMLSGLSGWVLLRFQNSK